MIFGYGYKGVSTSVPLSFQAQYATWVYVGSNYAKSYRAAGMKVLAYVNYWRNYTIDNPITSYSDIAPGGADAAAAAKTCSGSLVYDPKYGGGYLNDPRTSKSVAHAQFVIGLRSSYQGNYDALASDDTGGAGGTNALPCNYSYSSWLSATNAVNSQIGLPMFVNALNAWAVGGNPVTQVQALQPSNVLGGQCEMCYARNTGLIGANNWVNQENAEIAAVNAHKIFWDYARNTTAASSAQAMRTYIIASLLLTYDPNFTMLQEAFATPSNFEVMPESQLVPMNPLTTQSSVAGYLTAGGAYWRQYGSCYYRGQSVGKCAVAVNPNSVAATLPSNAYNHSLALSGNGVYDGGTASISGPKITKLGATSAAVLFP